MGVSDSMGLNKEIAGSFVRLARVLCCATLLVFSMVATAITTPTGKTFWLFESGQVRPLALSPDGSRLFAVNTPDNRLEIFDVSAGGLTHAGAVPVGLEPVAVAARSDDEVWVVNHLSDSVSIVDVSASPARVVRTLLVGDEPMDIVFAGTPDWWRVGRIRVLSSPRLTVARSTPRSRFRPVTSTATSLRLAWDVRMSGFSMRMRSAQRSVAPPRRS